MTKSVYTYGLEQNKADTLARIVERATHMSEEDRNILLQTAEAIIVVRRLRDLQLDNNDPKLAG